MFGKPVIDDYPTYYQVYAFDILQPDAREELNKILKKYPLAAPIEKHFTDDKCIVFCQFEIPDTDKLNPVYTIGSDKPRSQVDKKTSNEKETKADEKADALPDEIYEEETDTPANKLLQEVKGEKIK